MKEISDMQKRMSAQDVKTIANNNPICATKFTADPAVLVYDDTVYVYGTNDSQQAEATECKEANRYNLINTLNIYSSRDLVNWTYHGITQVGGWAKNSWAPAICCKKINGKDKFFLYFADSARGIGVMTSDSPLGPFTDPLGKALLDRSMPNMEGVHWLFDPAVLNDDDGKSYLYFGGGVKDDSAHPKSARCIELGEDMISVKGVAQEIDAPWVFEDSGINKFGDTYYYSYCANWDPRVDDTNPPIACIAYMTSKNPLGPFEYQGYTLMNPNNGNDHHWIFTYRGKNYIAYHTQKVSETIGLGGGSYRNLLINDFSINPDGSLPLQTANLEGVAQVGSFNPYGTVTATTMHSCKNIISFDDSTACADEDDNYICIKGADFAKGIRTFEAELAEEAEASAEIYVDELKGEPLMKATATGTRICGSAENCSVKGKHNIYIKLSKNACIRNWKFS